MMVRVWLVMLRVCGAWVGGRCLVPWGEGFLFSGGGFVDGSGWSGGVDSSVRAVGVGVVVLTVVVGVVVLMIVVGELYIGAGPIPLTPPYLTPPTEFS